MFANHPRTHSGLPSVRRLLALPLIMTFACSDRTDPVAPSKQLAPLGSASLGAYPGTTNTEFSGVQMQSEATGLSVKFNYTGVVTPAFTVGTMHDVLGSQVISVPAKKQAAGYWTAHAGGLESTKKYYYRLDNLTSTWYDSAKTLARSVTIDLDSIYVENDSDPGPGCGEWTVTLVYPTKWFGEMNWKLGATEYSFCSGSTYKFSGTGLQNGYRKVFAVPKDFYLKFDVKEQDDCFPYKSVCWEYNSTWGQWFDLPLSGTLKFDQTLETVHRPRARFWGKLIMSYEPW